MSFEPQAGRGFAVAAAEVKALATRANARSATTVKRISWDAGQSASDVVRATAELGRRADALRHSADNLLARITTVRLLLAASIASSLAL